MANKDDEFIRKKRAQHVIDCGAAVHTVKSARGAQAENDTVEYLLKHLDTRVAGDYRLLVNYNIAEREGNSLEMDVVVINRLGVFLIEVKDWSGIIKPHDNVWVYKPATRKNEEERKNHYNLVTYKARVLHAQLFAKGGSFSELSLTSVIGVVALTQGRSTYIPNSNCHDNVERIVDLQNPLIEVLTTHRQLHRKAGSTSLIDIQIQKISKTLFDLYVPPNLIVNGYRIERELSEGDLYSIAFEAYKELVPSRRVRLKRYQYASLAEDRASADLRKFQQSIKAVSALEDERADVHILRTLDFLADDAHHSDVFYEITELPTGPDLAQVMQAQVQNGKPMTLSRQINFLESISKALQHAHNHKDQRGRPAHIYHRNVCPETVFQMRDGTIKLGDFDFAKIMGGETVTTPEEIQLEKPYTAPELLKNSTLATAASDIYALGILWYFMASLPQDPAQFEPARIHALALPQQARTLLKRMTAEKRFDRPQNIEEVLEELAQIRDAELTRAKEREK